VRELKDRISAKIKLIPIGNGYSKIEISNWYFFIILV
jgi:hypothetical protein